MKSAGGVKAYATKDDWATPMALYEKLEAEFGPFDLDPCATDDNKKGEYWFTRRHDGLSRNWGEYSRIFMNPPYTREIDRWVQRAYDATFNGSDIAVCLLPAKTDTRWFHDYCKKGEIRFIRGRLKFEGAQYNAPFASMIVVFRKA